jgi:hypothetical protein
MPLTLVVAARSSTLNALLRQLVKEEEKEEVAILATAVPALPPLLPQQRPVLAAQHSAPDVAAAGRLVPRAPILPQGALAAALFRATHPRRQRRHRQAPWCR